MNINNTIKTINKSLWYYCLNAFDKNRFPDNVIEKLTMVLDFNAIPQSAFIKNENLLKVAHRSNMTSEKLISIIYYKIDAINHIDLKHFKFKNEDVIGLLLTHPMLLDYFNVNLHDFNNMQLIMLYADNLDIKNRIDLNNLILTEEEQKKVVRTYLQKRHIIELLDLKKLSTEETKNVFMEYGEEFLDKLDISKLKSRDWLLILKKRPELLQYCDSNIFEKSGGNDLVDLVIMFEHLSYLIDEKKDILNALSIERLIIHKPEKYLPILDVKKLKEKNWLTITKTHSYLKNKYIYSIS